MDSDSLVSALIFRFSCHGDQVMPDRKFNGCAEVSRSGLGKMTEVNEAAMAKLASWVLQVLTVASITLVDYTGSRESLQLSTVTLVLGFTVRRTNFSPSFSSMIKEDAIIRELAAKAFLRAQSS